MAASLDIADSEGNAQAIMSRINGDEGAELLVGLVPQGGRDWIAGVVYLENIVRAVRAFNGERLSICYVGNREHQLDAATHAQLGVPVHFYTHLSEQSWMRVAKNTIRSQRLPLSLERLAKRIGLSVLFPFHAAPAGQLPVPWIGWIPDFQHKRRPEFFSTAEQAQRDLCFQMIVANAPHIVVSSDDARADLMRWFPTAESRVSVLQFRTVLDSRWLSQDPRAVTAGCDLPPKYLVYPSQFWIHKNHRTVLAALSLLAARGRNVVLVCTGREYDYRHPQYGEELKNEITRLGLGSHVRLLGLLDRATQVQVIRGSAAVIQASVFEGWSALVEDARALGKRIYVSDIPVHREQHPDDATYFNPDCAEDLADLIDRDWPHLTPGPDLDRERHAVERQEGLIREFSCRFVDIAYRAAHQGSCDR
jgi:glycosyltransferase involved in cell wall biosynthesis